MENAATGAMTVFFFLTVTKVFKSVQGHHRKTQIRAEERGSPEGLCYPSPSVIDFFPAMVSGVDA